MLGLHATPDTVWQKAPAQEKSKHHASHAWLRQVVSAMNSSQQEVWQKLQLPAALYCSKQAPHSVVLTPLASRVQSPHFVHMCTQVEEGAHEHLEPSTIECLT